MVVYENEVKRERNAILSSVLPRWSWEKVCGLCLRANDSHGEVTHHAHCSLEQVLQALHETTFFVPLRVVACLIYACGGLHNVREYVGVSIHLSSKTNVKHIGKFNGGLLKRQCLELLLDFIKERVSFRTSVLRTLGRNFVRVVHGLWFLKRLLRQTSNLLHKVNHCVGGVLEKILLHYNIRNAIKHRVHGRNGFKGRGRY